MRASRNCVAIRTLRTRTYTSSSTITDKRGFLLQMQTLRPHAGSIHTRSAPTTYPIDGNSTRNAVLTSSTPGNNAIGLAT
jgi:hypothetical protein